MINNFKKRLLSRKNEGFTLVEMIVSMGIFAIITPFIITIMTTSIQMRDVSNSNREATLSSSFMNSVFTQDIETADYIKVSKDKLEIRSQDNCVVWFVDEYSTGGSNPTTETAVYRNLVVGASAVVNDSDLTSFVTPTETYEPRIIKNVSEYSSSHEYFKSDSKGLATYSIPLNSESNNFELKGSAQQSVSSSGPGKCFS